MVSAVHAGSNRMGVIRKQDEAISSEQVLRLVRLVDDFSFAGISGISSDSKLLACGTAWGRGRSVHDMEMSFLVFACR